MSLSPNAKALFDRAREAGAPSASEEAELFTRLSAAIAAAPASSPPPSSAPPTGPPPAPPAQLAGPTTAVGAKVVVAIATVGAIGLAGWWMVAAEPTATIRVAKATAPHASIEPPIEPARSAAPALSEADPENAQVVPRSLEDETDEDTVAEPPSSVVTPRRRRSPPPAARDASNLTAELALLEDAQRARRDGSSEAALAALAQHAGRFPRGLLQREREILRATVLCERGDLARGRAIAARFESSAHGAALARACELGGEGNDEAGQIP